MAMEAEDEILELLKQQGIHSEKSQIANQQIANYSHCLGNREALQGVHVQRRYGRCNGIYHGKSRRLRI